MRADHVRLIDGAFFCLHCGTRYTMNQPCPINVFTAAMNTFVDDHEQCVDRSKPGPGEQLDLLKDTPR